MESASELDSAPGILSASRSEKAGRFQCRECSQTFARVEHLTRHSRSHAKERYLKCSFCRKGFYRLDALKRHEQVHAEPKRSSLGKGSRACLACANGRRKCSGGQPCSGCQSRSVNCEYPETRRQSESSLPVRHSQSPIASGTEQIMSRPNDWENASSISGAGQSRRSGYAPHEQPGSFSNADTNVSYDASTPGESLYAQNEISIQAAISPGPPGSIPHSLVPMNLSAQLRESQPVFGGMIDTSNSDLHALSSRRDLQDAEAFSRTWYQNGFTSINWLPENWTPDFPMDDQDDIEASSHQQYSIQQNEPANTVAQTNFNTPATRNQNRNRLQGALSISAPQATEPHNSESPSSQSAHSTGQYYVDGEGARLPRVRKPPYRATDPVISLSPSDNERSSRGFMLPAVDEPRDSSSISTKNQVPLATYNEILRIFGLVCITSTHYAPFASNYFPTREYLSLSILFYIENFLPVLPCIHPATLNLSTSHWLFVLTMVSIGNHYIEMEKSGIMIVSTHEFTRRAIQFMIESDSEPQPDELSFTHIMLLNSIGMMYCGDERLAKFAKTYQSSLAAFCGDEWRRPTAHINSPTGSPRSIEARWKVWSEGECRRRTGYCIWLLDCMWVFHFQMRPLLSLEDASIPVPCQEVLWEANSALDWHQLFDPSTPSPSLHSAIQLAYIEKRLQSSMGEFSRILCIHALFRRTWEVEEYFTQPLTPWVPTADKQSIKVIQKSTPIRLPSIQTYSKWRNSACDVLDILHWHANSVIGATSGMEHPTVLHLHLARVILLTPIQKIVLLSRLMASEDSSHVVSDIEAATRDVQSWALEDQHKSRLAMIHAGVLFWHVRRYSVDAFYEPSSVFLATLAMWAYGSFAAQTAEKATESMSPHDSEDSEYLFPTAMQLDRPADDELVQLFVKRGATMKANITGVGNIRSVKGPVRVLTEGRRLLLGLKCWRYSQNFVWALTALIKACQKETPS